MVIQVKDRNDFKTQLSTATSGANSSGLVVVDFFATWCKPCTVIAPVFVELSNEFPNVHFIKVDVDECDDIAAEYQIRSLPNFIFLRNGQVVDRLTGCQPQQLRAKVVELSTAPLAKSASETGSQHGESGLKKTESQQQSLPLLSPVDCECLNESDAHPLGPLLKSDDPEAYLLSDTDAQLIIQVNFGQFVKIHSLQINGPPDCGPKTIKLFVNQTTTPDFSDCEAADAVQTIELEPKDLKDGAVVALNYVKFQRVTNLTIFVQDNQDTTIVTRIDKLRFLGSPVQTTNMQNFKRVTGTVGEGHG